MRKIVGLICIALGVLLIGLAIALPNYAYPRVAKAPLDPNSFQEARGEGVTVLVPRSVTEGGQGIFQDQTVRVTRYIRGEDRNGFTEGGDIVKPSPEEPFYRLSFKAEVEGQGLLQAYVEGAGFDAKTGLATDTFDGYVKTTDTDPVGEAVDHEGIMFKFPFKTEQKDYPFWDVNIRAAATARFDGEETIEGLKTYRFVQTIPDTVITQQTVPGSLIGIPEQGTVDADRIYSTVRTIWVEPNTGAVIKGSEKVNQRLAASGRTIPVIVGELTYTDDTVKRNVDQYASKARSLRFVSTLGPIGGWVLGPILLALGIALFVLGRRDDDADDWDDDRSPNFQTV